MSGARCFVESLSISKVRSNSDIQGLIQHSTAHRRRPVAMPETAAVFGADADHLRRAMEPPITRSLTATHNALSLKSGVSICFRATPHLRRVIEIFHHFAALWVVENGIAAGALDDFARVVAHAEARDPIRDAPRLRDVVRDDHDGMPLLESHDQLFDGLGGFRIERACRLVHQDDFRLHGEGAGEAEALLLADGK